MPAIECAFPLLAAVALFGTNKLFWFGVITAAALDRKSVV